MMKAQFMFSYHLVCLFARRFPVVDGIAQRQTKNPLGGLLVFNGDSFDAVSTLTFSATVDTVDWNLYGGVWWIERYRSGQYKSTETTSTCFKLRRLSVLSVYAAEIRLLFQYT